MVLEIQRRFCAKIFCDFLLHLYLYIRLLVIKTFRKVRVVFLRGVWPLSRPSLHCLVAGETKLYHIYVYMKLVSKCGLLNNALLSHELYIPNIEAELYIDHGCL